MTGHINRAALLARLAEASDAINHYRETEEVDSLAAAEEAIEDSAEFVRGASAEIDDNTSQDLADAAQERPDISNQSTALARFDGYRVQPVVETTAPDGIEKSYEAFSTLAEAEAEIERFKNQVLLDGAEKQQVLWSVYGLRQGVAQHIADRLTEAEAFALPYAISGVIGISGQSVYRTRELWVVLHNHRHSSDTWVVACAEEPTETQLVRCLKIDFEPSREESIKVERVGDVPTLDWQTGDDAPFVEPEC